MSLPLRLQRRHVDDDAAARIGGLAKTNRQHIFRNTKILNGSGKGERVRRNDAVVTFHIYKTAFIEGFGIHRGGMDVGKYFKLIRAAHVVAVARGAVRNHFAAIFIGAYLSGLKRFDHPLAGLFDDPAIGFDCHSIPYPFYPVTVLSS